MKRAPRPHKFIVSTKTFKPVLMKDYDRQDVFMLEQYDTLEEAERNIPKAINEELRSLEITIEAAQIQMAKLREMLKES